MVAFGSERPRFPERTPGKSGPRCLSFSALFLGVSSVNGSFPVHSAASPPHSVSNMREYSPEANSANRKFVGDRLWYGSDSI